MVTMLPGLAAVALAAGAVLALVAPTGAWARRLSLGGALLGCGAALGLAATVLRTGQAWRAVLPGLLQPLGGVAFSLDPLGAFFLLLVAGTGVLSSLYGIGYERGQDHGARGRVRHACLNVFLAGMCVVTAADNVATFLFGWEIMALASYLLVVSDARHEETLAAGAWYATMTHAGFVALLAAFVTLAHGGPLDFGSMRAHAAGLSPHAALAVFVLGAIAFGSKAGLVPLHVWLPRAHPAAPSHVSALMSAAMVKLGVYGAIRLFFDLLPAAPAWWGGVLLTAGVVTALAGVLYAVTDIQLKRALAYSTIENVGLIFVGLGFALLMRGEGYPSLAALGLAVCLLHSLNHAAFKSLLFLGAGAVIHRTHATSLEAYGGLIRRMPYTAVCFLVGALALAAVPPLNGFPSEWLTFQVLVAGAGHTASTLAIVLPLALGGIALAAGLAAVSAVRLFGITFLALPRSADAAAATEVAPSMRTALGLAAGACVFLGVAPALVLPALARVVAGLGLPLVTFNAGPALVVPMNGSLFRPATLAVLLVAIAASGMALVTIRVRRVRRAGVWNCGRAIHAARGEYTAASFAEPLRRVFRGIYRPTQEVAVETHPASRYFVRSITYRGDLAPWLEQALYGPIIRAVRAISLRTRKLQTGSLQTYLALLPLALLLLLLVARWIR